MRKCPKCNNLTTDGYLCDVCIDRIDRITWIAWGALGLILIAALIVLSK